MYSTWVTAFIKSRLTLVACFCLALCPVSGAGAQSQSIVVNLAPDEVNETVFQRLAQLGAQDDSRRVDLGAAAIFSYLNQPRRQCEKSLTDFLALAQRYEVPVVVQLDGEQWWGARPDLWNWWDPARPGYEPRNRENVEWSGWSPESALKIAWRNWGRQIRVLPPPNLMSERYRRACHEEMRVLIPLILNWRNRLPEEKRRLLIGIKLGWESSIGVNSFYYPNGNDMLNRPESEDPQSGLEAARVPDRGVAAIGYAAVSTIGLATGGELREADLTEVVRRHLEDLCALAAELGAPRDILFTHVAGWKEGENLYEAGLNRYACPGWSFYRHASDPAEDVGVQRALRKSDAPYWAAVEWLLTGEHDESHWRNAFERTLSDPKCRYLCIYNWSGIKDDLAALGAIRRVVGE
ncbi:MAG: hypothetical protein GC154_14785 [bacterium]|nr:hypothetical protein [bacterium]